jgi:hypothetical protein
MTFCRPVCLVLSGLGIFLFPSAASVPPFAPLSATSPSEDEVSPNYFLRLKKATWVDQSTLTVDLSIHPFPGHEQDVGPGFRHVFAPYRVDYFQTDRCQPMLTVLGHKVLSPAFLDGRGDVTIKARPPVKANFAQVGVIEDQGWIISQRFPLPSRTER